MISLLSVSWLFKLVKLKPVKIVRLNFLLHHYTSAKEEMQRKLDLLSEGKQSSALSGVLSFPPPLQYLSGKESSFSRWPCMQEGEGSHLVQSDVSSSSTARILQFGDDPSLQSRSEEQQAAIPKCCRSRIQGVEGGAIKSTPTKAQMMQMQSGIVVAVRKCNSSYSLWLHLQ